MKFSSIYRFLSSLRLTVVLLILSMILVFIGTLEQVRYGIWVVQKMYFHSWFVYFPVPNTPIQVPLLPGGYLLGWLLVINLACAHFRYFKRGWKQAGIMMIHGGLVLILLGELSTSVWQVESYMRIPEGETRSYSEDFQKLELAVIDRSGEETDTVVSIPVERLRAGNSIQHPALPFMLRVEACFANTRFFRRMEGDAEPRQATAGIGRNVKAVEVERTFNPDERNLTTAMVGIDGTGGPVGTWMVSNAFAVPQRFAFEDRTFTIELRPKRYYRPYELTLIDFTHEKYPGTEIPSHFSSRLVLDNPETGENREVEVYMNHPLRYAGLTYYQAGFEAGDTVTVLQVVRNPAWLLPYISSTLITLGLIVQFSIHLFRFQRRRKGAEPAS